jgi:hypothetical protein
LDSVSPLCRPLLGDESKIWGTPPDPRQKLLLHLFDPTMLGSKNMKLLQNCQQGTVPHTPVKGALPLCITSSGSGRCGFQTRLEKHDNLDTPKPPGGRSSCTSLFLLQRTANL